MSDTLTQKAKENLKKVADAPGGRLKMFTASGRRLVDAGLLKSVESAGRGAAIDEITPAGKKAIAA